MQLNAAPLCPGRAAGCARLRAAPLQLAPGTSLVLDETMLSAGQLSAQGITNLKVTAVAEEKYTQTLMPQCADICHVKCTWAALSGQGFT